MGIPALQMVSRFAEASHEAATEVAEKASAFDTLGIDPKQLVFQIIAFGILVFALARWVFPVLIKAIDERQATIERSLEAAKQATDDLEKAEAKVEKLLAEARKESADIVALAHKEATAMVEEAESKAQKKAEHIVAEAKSQLDGEVLKARAVLRKDAKALVADATEKIIGQKLTSAADEKLIEQALSEAK
jgi:F-type H+-transporting ATPase subunit b